MKEINTTNTKQLMLVDDDPNLILLVKDYLEFRGYQVITAENILERLYLGSKNTYYKQFVAKANGLGYH